MRPPTRVHSGGAKAGAWFAGAVVAARVGSRTPGGRARLRSDARICLGVRRGLATMKLSHQQADPAATLRAIENEPEREARAQTSDTQKASGRETTA